MGSVAAIGEDALIRGFALAGVLVLPAAEPAEVAAAWAQLPADVDVVILTERSRSTISDDVSHPFVVVTR
jgi:vacuolar-type H+-ATPase subunit F/Vma7